MRQINFFPNFVFLLLSLFSHSGFAVDYFGYFAIAMPGVGDNQSAVADRSNVVWIHNQSDLTSLINSINTAAQNGKKVIVSLTPLFQKGDGTFNTSWSSSWVTWVNALSPYSNAIVAFYPMDEPSSSRVSLANAQIMVNAIHSAFPGIAVAAIYGNQADATSQGLFDWIGIDCYSNGAFKCSGHEYTQVYADMRLRMTANQRIILVPQVGLPVGNDGCCIDALKSEAKRFHSLAYGDPKVIGIFPFIWENISGWYGLQRYSTLQPVWQMIGVATSWHWSFSAGIVPVYRFASYTNNDHFFTTSAPEGINASRANNFTFEGIGFSVYGSQQSGAAPLYRCRTSTSHFISRDSGCESNISEGIYGYVQSTQVSGTVPLYRFVNTRNSIHLETIYYSEGVSANLAYEGVLGYVPDVSMPSAGY